MDKPNERCPLAEGWAFCIPNKYVGIVFTPDGKPEAYGFFSHSKFYNDCRAYCTPLHDVCLFRLQEDKPGLVLIEIRRVNGERCTPESEISFTWSAFDLEGKTEGRWSATQPAREFVRVLKLGVRGWADAPFEEGGNADAD